MKSVLEISICENKSTFVYNRGKISSLLTIAILLCAGQVQTSIFRVSYIDV